MNSFFFFPFLLVLKMESDLVIRDHNLSNKLFPGYEVAVQ